MTFVIPSRDDQSVLELSAASGDYFAAELRSRDITARVLVWSYRTTGLGSFFRELARDWRGWPGTREWRSFESELELRAESDKAGHTYLTVALACESPPRWTASASLVLEAGQLDVLAASAMAFEQRTLPAD